MFRKKLLILVLTVCGIAALLVTLLYFSSGVRGDPGVPDTEDSQAIQQTFRDAYKLMDLAAQTFDVSEFPTVFVDNDDYALSEKQQEAVTQVMGVQTLDKAGYLTAMQAYYLAWGKGAADLEAAMRDAEAEGRVVTQEEMRELAAAHGNRVPALPRQEGAETKLMFESIEIRGDTAVVRFDDGAALQEATLVKIEGRWYISGIRPIWVHF